MGKRIIVRARGRGGMQYRAQSHRYVCEFSYLPIQKTASSAIKGIVKDILHDPSKTAPVALIRMDGIKEDVFHIAPEGLEVGRHVEYGGEPALGNVLMLKDIPLGTRVFGVEASPNSGPKFCRCAGSFATISNKGERDVTVQFSSGHLKSLNPNCRATIGVPAGGGRTEKPFIKAGTKHYAMKARGKLYSRSKGVAMSPTDHPFGGRRKTPRPSKNVSRNQPPGSKVGSIAARRSGRRKGAKK
jgi:large subunit ribosomal protein L2